MRGVRLLIVCALGVCGAAAMFWPTVSSGLARMQTDPGDTRHLNYVLEHDYRWARGDPAHRELWSPPMFHPEPNTAAYSETLLGVAPIYAAFRFAGAAPDTSLQLLTLTCALLNFAAALLFFRRGLRFGLLPSAAAAYLFAYGSIRAVKVGHQHLIPHFYTMLAAIALAMIFRDGTSRRSRTFWVAAFFAGMLAQLYACFYLTWLLCFGLFVLATVALLFGGTRQCLLSVLREQAIPVAIGLASCALLALPLVRHHLEAARSVGLRDFGMAELFLAPPQAWISLGPANWIYGRFAGLFPAVSYPFQKCLGLGAVTSLLVLAGFWRARRNPVVRVVAITSVVIMLCVTLWPGGITAWRVLFEVLPGAKAIRAVSRIALVLLIPAAWGLALALEGLGSSMRGRIAAALLALAAFVEQGQTMPSYDKAEVRRRVAALSSSVPRGCAAFYYLARGDTRPAHELQIDAMWASLESGIPTVNGYSSNLPPGWETLFANEVAPGATEHEARLRESLARWATDHRISPDAICVVSISPAP